MMRSFEPSPAEPPDSIPFPLSSHRRPQELRDADVEAPIRAVENVSRRLEDLARRLNCLGFFEEPDPDRPRAA